MTAPLKLKFPLMEEKPSPLPRNPWPRVKFYRDASTGKVLFEFTGPKAGNPFEAGDGFTRELRDKDVEDFPEAYQAFKEADTASAGKAKR